MTEASFEVEECDTEQAFFELWHSQLGGEVTANTAPTQLAEQGGRLADRAAWVFVAGYQGALRQCFPALRSRAGWVSYLVSEVRDEPKSPTCTVDLNSEVLSGTKNWVAASAHLQWLVVNAAVGSTSNSSTPQTSTCNLLVAADAPGVELIAKSSGRFLPELETGKAQFSDVALAGDAVFADDESHAHLFGLIEARCLLVALAAHFAQQAPGAAGPAQSLLLSSGLVTAELGTRASLDVLLDAMDQLVEWFEGWHSKDDSSESAVSQRIRKRWADDKRLLQMHRPLLAKQRKRYD